VLIDVPERLDPKIDLSIVRENVTPLPG